MPADIILLKDDRVLITQVLVNILNNSINYTPEGSEISVSVNKIENEIIFEVSDNGPGISESDLPV